MVPKLTEEILGFENKIANHTRPTYTYEEIVEKLMRTHTGKLSRKDCETLMTRGVHENPPGSGRYQFSHDIRVHYLPITGINSRQVSVIAKQFR